MNIVLCHSNLPSDKQYVNELKKHLNVLFRNQEVIKEIWSIEDVQLGHFTDNTYNTKLKNANILIPFLSPDYLSLDRTYNLDIPFFKANINKGKNIIPLLIRECLWKEIELFKDVKIFPENGIAINDKKLDNPFKEFVELIYNQVIIKDYKDSSMVYDEFYLEFRKKFINSNLILNIANDKFNLFPEKVSYLISSTIANNVVLPAVLKWKEGVLKTGYDVNEEILSESNSILSSMNLNDRIINLAQEIILDVLEEANEIISQFKIEKHFSGIPPNFNMIVFFAKDFESEIIGIANSNQVIIDEFLDTLDELRMELFYNADHSIHQISKLEIQEMTNSGNIWVVIILFLISIFLGPKKANEIGLRTNVPKLVRHSIGKNKLEKRVRKIESELQQNIYNEIKSKRLLDKFSKRIHFAMVEILNDKIDEIKACG